MLRRRGCTFVLALALLLGSAAGAQQRSGEGADQGSGTHGANPQQADGSSGSSARGDTAAAADQGSGATRAGSQLPAAAATSGSGATAANSAALGQGQSPAQENGAQASGQQGGQGTQAESNGGIGSGGGKVASIPMQDCSNDESGLPLPSLKVEAAWESHGLREATDITIVTQLSPRRSKALAELCWLWGGVIAATVYIPLLDGKLVPEEGAPADWAVFDVITHLSSFHRQMETEGPCKLDMTLYSEAVESQTMAAFYPVNALRNRALKQAKTEVVLLDDVDFVIGGDLSDPEKYDAIVRRTRQKQAVVLPAFEPQDGVALADGTRIAMRALNGGKGKAAEMYRKKKIKPFHIERWEFAHRNTNYEKWTSAEDFYEVQYENDFEPYVLIDRASVPPYDERLRGYFENKVVHSRHIATLGTKFVVHPSAFVMHLPHPESRARLMIIDPANIALRDKVQGLGGALREWIDAGAYTPVTSEACTPEQQAAALQRWQAKADAAAAAAAVAAEQQQAPHSPDASPGAVANGDAVDVAGESQQQNRGAAAAQALGGSGAAAGGASAGTGVTLPNQPASQSAGGASQSAGGVSQSADGASQSAAGASATAQQAAGVGEGPQSRDSGSPEDSSSPGSKTAALGAAGASAHKAGISKRAAASDDDATGLHGDGPAPMRAAEA